MKKTEKWLKSVKNSELNVNCGRERVRIDDEFVGKQESYTHNI